MHHLFDANQRVFSKKYPAGRKKGEGMRQKTERHDDGSHLSPTGSLIPFSLLPSPPPQPALHQQTLVTSFTLGGIGLHTGEYGKEEMMEGKTEEARKKKMATKCARVSTQPLIIFLFSLTPTAFVRVRPAHAGDGRYFVAVPRGTNAARYSPVTYHADASPTSGGGGGGSDAEAAPEEGTAAAFTGYLRALDAGFAGDFAAWAATHAPASLPPPTPPPPPLEAPVPRAGSLSGAGVEEVEACIANAAPSPSGRSTQLSSPSPTGPTFTSVEHLLAALEGMGVGNARIEVEPGAAGAGVVVPSSSSPPQQGEGGNSTPAALELPILDGSALGWAVEVVRAGVRPAPPRPGQEGGPLPPKTVPSVPRTLTLHDAASPLPGGAFATFTPGPAPALSVGVGAPPDTPAIGRQWFAWAPSAECGHYRWAVAPARDWVASAAALIAARAGAGAYRAGTVGTTLVAAGDTWLDPGKVRFPGDEPARHEMGKAIGDLSLLAAGGGLGLPLGHFTSWNATPALRLDLVRALAAESVGVEVGAAARAALEAGKEGQE